MAINIHLVWTILAHTIRKAKAMGQELKLLIGTISAKKQYEAQKKSAGAPIGNTNSSNQLGEGCPVVTNKDGTAGRIAQEHGIGQRTVKSNEHFARGLDAADEVKPGFRDEVLKGEVSAPKSYITDKPKCEDGYCAIPHPAKAAPFFRYAGAGVGADRERYPRYPPRPHAQRRVIVPRPEGY